MPALILIALAGLAAQLVDGGIGMGFGVTSTTILIFLAGLGPAQASAVVHVAQLGTTAISGISHWRFGNVNWRFVLFLGVPGAIGGFIGATLLSNLPLDAAQPVTATLLSIIGLNLVWRFSRGRVRRSSAEKAHYSSPFLVGIGSVGGVVDATGGGGWGPVTTSTLMGLGREHPRYVVGTVSASEFLVTLGSSIGFAIGLWDEIIAQLPAVLALLIGGSIAAPVAAWIVSRINPVALGGLVGTGIVALNLPKVLGGITQLADATPIDTVWPLQVLVLLAGIAMTIRGARRRARELATDPTLPTRTAQPDSVRAV